MKKKRYILMGPSYFSQSYMFLSHRIHTWMSELMNVFESHLHAYTSIINVKFNFKVQRSLWSSLEIFFYISVNHKLKCLITQILDVKLQWNEKLNETNWLIKNQNQKLTAYIKMSAREPIVCWGKQQYSLTLHRFMLHLCYSASLRFEIIRRLKFKNLKMAGEDKGSPWTLLIWFCFVFMVFNTTFNNISVISWRSV